MLERLRIARGRRNVPRLDSPPWRAERLDAEASGLQPFWPGIRLKAGLRHQVAHEPARVGKMAPDARQEQGAASADPENEPVTVGLERSSEFGLAGCWNRPRVREN